MDKKAEKKKMAHIAIATGFGVHQLVKKYNLPKQEAMELFQMNYQFALKEHIPDAIIEKFCFKSRGR